MALRDIGILTDKVFGTGSADVLSKETTIEATTDVVCKDGTGAVLGWKVGNEVQNVRETKYAAATDLTAALTGGVIRKTVSASNEDFQKVTIETRALFTGT